MDACSPLLTAKDLMKTKLPKLPKPEKAREPRCDCRQTNYSPSALLMMEQATGMRFAKSTEPVKAPVAAVDAE
jgi:hypothetical protein